MNNNQSTTVNKPQIIGLQTVSHIYKDSVAKQVAFDSKLTLDNFIQIGCVSYFLGLDYMNNTDIPTKVGLENIAKRFAINKITFKQFEQVYDFLKQLDNSELTELNRFQKEVQDQFESKILNGINDGNKLQQQIYDVIKNLGYIKNKYAEDIYNRFIVKGKNYEYLTYHDLLVFVNTIYEVVELDMDNYFQLIEVLNNPKIKEEISKASIYYELQKFVLIFSESLLIWKEQLDNFNLYYKFLEEFLNQITPEYNNNFNIETFNKIFGEVYNNLEPELIKIGESTEIKSIQSDETTLNTSVPTNSTSLNDEIIDKPLDNPELTFKSIFEDTNSALTTTGQLNLDYVNSFDDFIKLMEFLLGDEDLVQPVYTLLLELNKLIKSGDKEKLDFKNILEIKDFKGKLEEYIKSIENEYNNIIADYVTDIDKDLINQLYLEINKVIYKLIVTGTEAKSILLSQLDTNLLVTPKNVHQILEIIDEQKINVRDLNIYINFKTFWNDDKFKLIREIIANSMKLEYFEVKQKFLKVLNQVIK